MNPTRRLGLQANLIFVLGLLLALMLPAVKAQSPAPATESVPARPSPSAGATEFATATAFLVAPRLLVSAQHGLINRDRVFVGAGRGGKFVRAKVVATDDRLDLALLEADVAGEPLSIAAWDSVPIGIEVAALG
ncbi:MAG: trypsin-like peptidase domain-containing protein, partial [Betaproteobacteria bacterium]